MNAETIIDNDTGEAMPIETQKSIAEMNRVASGLAAMAKQYEQKPDCSTDQGYEKAKAEQKEIAKTRIAVDKAHKAGKSFYLEGGRRIDAMKNQILKAISPLEDARKDAVKAVDDEKARIEREAAEKEQSRIEAIEMRIRWVRDIASSATTLEQTLKGIETIAAERNGAFDYEEFKDAVFKTFEDVDAALESKRVALQAQVDEAARIVHQKAEQDEREAQQKAEREKFEAEQKAAAEKLAEQRAEIERGKRELAEAQAAEQRRKDESIAEAKRKDEQVARDRAQAEQAEKDKQRALEAAETKRLADVESARLQAISDEQARINAENARIAEEKAEAERAPDKQKLQAWLDSIPAMKTKAGKAAALKLVDQSQAVVNSLGSRAKPA